MRTLIYELIRIVMTFGKFQFLQKRVIFTAEKPIIGISNLTHYLNQDTRLLHKHNRCCLFFKSSAKNVNLRV
jgi:hypothetical protein